MRVLITGATGFIGKHLLSLLNQHEVLILSRSLGVSTHPNCSHLQCNLGQLDLVQKELVDFAPEVCIHLAWEALPDYSLETCQHNFDLSINLVKTMGMLGCQKVFISGSCWEYGSLNGEVKESYISKEVGLFASFKTSLRLVAESLSDDYSFDLIWGRIFFVYGEGQRVTSLIPSCIQSLSQNQSPDIRTPEAINDFIHVMDVAQAIKNLIETPNSAGIYNISSGQPHSVDDIVCMISKILGKESFCNHKKNIANGEGFWGDISELTRATGFTPQVSLKQGIQAIIKG
jgi:nucleoside-diphosphate-sugar epimerase